MTRNLSSLENMTTRPSSGDSVSIRSDSRENVHPAGRSFGSRPQSRENGNRVLLSRSSSSRAILSRNNGKMRSAMRTLHETILLTRDTGSMLEERADLCCEAVQFLSEMIEMSKETLDWIRDSGCLENVAILLEIRSASNLTLSCMNLLQQTMLVDRRANPVPGHGCMPRELTCDLGYQRYFCNNLRGSAKLKTLICKLSPDENQNMQCRMRDCALEVLEVMLHDLKMDEQRSTVALEFLPELMEMIRNQTTSVTSKCHALACLSKFNTFVTVRAMTDTYALNPLVRFLHSPNIVLKICCSKVLEGLVEFPAASQRLEMLGLTAALISLLEENNSILFISVVSILKTLLRPPGHGTLHSDSEWWKSPDNNTIPDSHDALTLQRIQIISRAFELILQAMSSSNIAISSGASQLLSILLLAATSVQNPNKQADEQAAPVDGVEVSNSPTSTIPNIILQVVLNKPALTCTLVMSMSSPAFCLQDSSIQLAEAIVHTASVAINSDFGQELLDIVQNQAILWSLSTLVTGIDSSMLVRERACKLLLKLSYVAFDVSNILANPLIKSAFECLDIDLVPHLEDSSGLAGQALTPKSFQLFDVLNFCLENVTKVGLFIKIRLQSAVWLQGVVRSSHTIRETLMIDMFPSRVMSVLREEDKDYPILLKCKLLDIVSDLARAPWSIGGVSLDPRIQKRLMILMFYPVHKLVSKLIMSQYAQVEGRISLLICSCCNLIGNLVRYNIDTSTMASRSGLLVTCLKLVQSSIQKCQRAGLRLLHNICCGNPSISKVLFRVYENADENSHQSHSPGNANSLGDYVMGLVYQSRPLDEPIQLHVLASKLFTTGLELDAVYNQVAQESLINWILLIKNNSFSTLKWLKDREDQDLERGILSLAHHLLNPNTNAIKLAACAVAESFVHMPEGEFTLERNKIVMQMSEGLIDSPKCWPAKCLQDLTVLTLCCAKNLDFFESTIDIEKTICRSVELIRVADEESDSEDFLRNVVKLLSISSFRFRMKFYNAGGFDAFVETLQSARAPKLRTTCCECIQQLISVDYLSVKQPSVVKTASEVFFEQLHTSVRIAAECVWMMLNSSKAPSEVCAFTQALGALYMIAPFEPILLKQVVQTLTSGLTSESTGVICSCAESLATICSYSRGKTVPEYVLSCGAIPCLIALLACPDTTVQMGVMKTLKSVCRVPSIRRVAVLNKVIEHVVRLLKSSDSQVSVTAAEILSCWIHSALSIKELNDFSGIEVLLNLLASDFPQVVVNVASCISRLMSKADIHGSRCWALLHASFRALGGFSRLKDCLRSKSVPASRACLDCLRQLLSLPHFGDDVNLSEICIDISAYAHSGLSDSLLGPALACLTVVISQRLGLQSNDVEFLTEKLAVLHGQSDCTYGDYFCVCVRFLANEADIRRDILSNGYFPLLSEQLSSDFVVSRTVAAAALESWCSADHTTITSWAKAHSLRPLFELLLSDCDEGSAQAAKTLTELCKTESIIRTVCKPIPNVKGEGFQIILDVMSTAQSIEVQQSCCAMFAEVANHSKWKSNVKELTFNALVNLLSSNSSELVSSSCAALLAMSNGNGQDEEFARHGVCSILSSLLQEYSVQIRCQVCEVITKIGSTEKCKAALLQVNVFELLLNLLHSEAPILVSASLSAIEVLLSKYECQLQFLHRNGLQTVQKILLIKDSSIRCGAAKVIAVLARNFQSKGAVVQDSSLLKILDSVITSDEDRVAEAFCNVVSILAGNESEANAGTRSKLASENLVGSLCAVLRGSNSVKAAAVLALSKFQLSEIRMHLSDADIIVHLISLMSTQERRCVLAANEAVAKFVRCDQGLRLQMIQAGVFPLLSQLLRIDSNLDVSVRGAAANTLTALVDCLSCRWSCDGLQSRMVDIQGHELILPSIKDILRCPHRETCLLCAKQLSELKIAEAVSILAQSSNRKARMCAAEAIAACSVGIPTKGVCEFGLEFANGCTSGDVLSTLEKMLGHKSLNVRAEAVQTAACRCIANLCLYERGKKMFCSRGFINLICEVLRGSTCGRLKAAAACALARLSSSDSVFFWNCQTNQTYWEMPQELKTWVNSNGSDLQIPEEDIAYDIVKQGYWVRGFFRPIVKVSYRELVTGTFQVTSGLSQKLYRLKSDCGIVTKDSYGLLSDIIELFSSELYEGSVKGLIAEALTVLCEHDKHRQYVISRGCIPAIVHLLTSNSKQTCAQALNLLSVLMRERDARDSAAQCGTVQKLFDILTSAGATHELLQAAMLALAALCDDASNQVLALQVGLIMPLSEFLRKSNTALSYCALECCRALSLNDHNKRALCLAGVTSTLVHKIDSHVPLAALARMLATLTNLVADADNCDDAVECGIMMRLINLRSHNSLVVYDYALFSVRNIFQADRWKMKFIECGLIPFLMGVCLTLKDAIAQCKDHRNLRKSLITGLSHIIRSITTYETFREMLVGADIFTALCMLMESLQPEAQALACETTALLSSKDSWKVAARKAGVIPLLAGLVRSKVMQVRLESAAAIRALASDPASKSLLVTCGCLHGLRDMLEMDSQESKLRAAAAIQVLCQHDRNAAALAASGIIRPLVNLLGCDSAQIQLKAAGALQKLGRHRSCDARGDMAAWGAVEKVARGLEAAGEGDGEVGLELVRCCSAMVRNVHLDAGAARLVRSHLVVQARVGHVPADDVGRRIRLEMAARGVPGRLSQLHAAGQGSLHAPGELAECAGTCLAYLRGEMDLG